MYKIDVDDVRDSMDCWFSMDISAEQVEEVFEATPGLRDDLTQVGEWETCCREEFANAVGLWVGMDRGWPSYADGDECAATYLKEFWVKAAEKGIFRFE
jgi:hypothetical protein